MQTQFRQGIIQHQPFYLTWSGDDTIALSTTNKPTIVALSSQDSNYLHIEERHQSPLTKWTNLPTTGENFWIYWDMNTVTSRVTYGYTRYEPVVSTVSPLNPMAGQHWFDINSFTMKEWNGNNWSTKIRVFAAKIENGTSIRLMPVGTQVGRVGYTLVGKVLYDSAGQPIKKSNKQFVTSEDVFYFNGTDIRTGSLETTVVVGKALENIPEYHAVKLDGFNEFRLANYEDCANALVGLSIESAGYLDSISIVPIGVVTNPNWNWPTVNAKLWVGMNGELTVSDPGESDPHKTPQTAIARVISPTSILFGQGYHTDLTMTSAEVINSGDATSTTAGMVRLSVAPLDPLQPIAAGSNDPRLTDNRHPLPHTHDTTAVLYNDAPLSSILNQQALDIAGKLNRSGGILTGSLQLYSNPVSQFDAVTKQYVDGLVQNNDVTLTGIAPIQVTSGTTVSISQSSSSSSGSMSSSDKIKLDGISQSANNYIHPVTDGNLHVPATGTTNSGKVLTAGATAGSLSWTTPQAASVTSVAGRVGSVTLTKSDVGLGSVDNTSDANKPISVAVQAALNTKLSTNTTTFTGNAATATTLQTPRTINGVSFDGSSNITISATDPIPRLAATEKGVANGIATLDGTGMVPASQLPSYVDDVVEYASLASFPSTGLSGKIYIALDNNQTYRWSGSSYIHITSGAVDSVAGKTGVVVLDKSDVGLGNVTNAAQVTSVSGTSPISSSGGTTPVISMAAATASANGYMSSTYASKLDGIATGATNYIHPTTDGNMHVPATGTTNTGKVLTAGATAGSLSWATPAASGVTSVTGTAPISSSGGTTPIISISSATTSAAGVMSSADKLKLDNLTGTGFYDNGDVVGSKVITVSNGKMQRIKLTGATNVSFTGWPSSGSLGELLLEVEAGGINLALTGITWIKSDGSFTTNFLLLNIALQTSGIDFITLWTRNGGTTVYGKVIR